MVNLGPEGDIHEKRDTGFIGIMHGSGDGSFWWRKFHRPSAIERARLGTVAGPHIRTSSTGGGYW